MRFAAAKNQIIFDGFKASGAGGESVGAAAGMSTMPSAYASFRKNAWNPAAVAGAGVKGHTELTNAIKRARAGVQISKDQAIAIKKKAQAEREAYEAAGQASKTSGIISGIGGVITAAAPFVLPFLSDETTKNTVDTIDDAISILRNLRPVSFYYNKEYSLHPELKHYGFIAQEYQKHMPDATYTEKSTGKLCIDTSELIALLVGAIQTLEGRVRRLEVKSVLEPVGLTS